MGYHVLFLILLALLFDFLNGFDNAANTTHAITGAIMGIGSTKRLTAVRWGFAGQIAWAWILTIPCSAAISAITYDIVM